MGRREGSNSRNEEKCGYKELRKRTEIESKRMGELATEIGEGNIAKKVKNENKIQIKERPGSLFHTTFQWEERRRKSKARREKEQQKKREEEEAAKEEEEEEAPDRVFPPLFSQVSTSAGLTFPLTGPTLLALDSLLCLFKHFH